MHDIHQEYKKIPMAKLSLSARLFPINVIISITECALCKNRKYECLPMINNHDLGEDDFNKREEQKIESNQSNAYMHLQRYEYSTNN